MVTAAELVTKLRNKGWMIATAESCTGGMVAAAITDVSGASQVFDRGFVTYSNAAKRDLLSVPEELITRHGAVSEEVARAMAEGALRHAHANVAVAVTGVAGPLGGTAEKPVGLVHFACATAMATSHLKKQFDNMDRSAVRQASVAVALQMVADAL
jgi:nicotinamide-nucleotide amidase